MSERNVSGDERPKERSGPIYTRGDPNTHRILDQLFPRLGPNDDLPPFSGPRPSRRRRPWWKILLKIR